MSKVGTDNKRAMKAKEKERKDRGRDKDEEDKKEEESEISIDESRKYRPFPHILIFSL
jgi:hypothetical protein